MPDSEAILSAEEVASMVAPGLCRGGLAPKPESTLALAASHEALREQVAVLTEERDAAGAAANRAEIRAFAAEARVAVLEAGLRRYGRHLATCRVGPQNTPLAIDQPCSCGLDDVALGGVPAAAPEMLCPECNGSELPSPCWKCGGTSRVPPYPVDDWPSSVPAAAPTKENT